MLIAAAVLAAVVSLGTLDPGVPHRDVSPPEAPGSYLLAMRAPIAAGFCAACQCCDGWCVSLGAERPAPKSPVEARPCGTGCPPHASCYDTEEEELLEEEEFAALWAAIRSADRVALADFSTRYPKSISLVGEQLVVNRCGSVLIYAELDSVGRSNLLPSP